MSCTWDAEVIQAHAATFDEPSFIDKIRSEVDGLLDSGKPLGSAR
ncbi:hypothetical protein ACPYOC_12305 [Ornithinimicrobium sp. W1665]